MTIAQRDRYPASRVFAPYGLATGVVKASPGGTTLHSTSALTDEFGNLEMALGKMGVDLVTGTHISVSDGVTTKELTLVALSIDAIAVENTVTGSAPPNASLGVDADVGGEWPGLDVTADGSGYWTADFGTIGVDIAVYTHVGASISDVDGDQTSADVEVITPEQAVVDLSNAVMQLVDDGTLAAQAAKPLRMQLRQASLLLEEGRTRTAANMLKGFTQLVRGQVRSHRLPAESTAALIGAATRSSSLSGGS